MAAEGVGVEIPVCSSEEAALKLLDDGIESHGAGNINTLYINAGLTSFPERILDLPSLTELDVSHNAFSSETSIDFGKLVSLTSLNLGNLAATPLGLGELKQLKSLVLNTKYIDTVPDEVLMCGGLTRLDMSRRLGVQRGPRPRGAVATQGLRQLPAAFGSALTSLEQLCLSRNYLSELPDSVTALVNLTMLDLRDNNLEISPLSKLNQLMCGRLESVKLEGNPCVNDNGGITSTVTDTTATPTTVATTEAVASTADRAGEGGAGEKRKRDTSEGIAVYRDPDAEDGEEGEATAGGGPPPAKRMRANDGGVGATQSPAHTNVAGSRPSLR